MHAYLVSQFTQADSPDTLNIHPNPSIGIDEVRLIQNFLSRKPTQKEFNTVIINSAEKLTLPAQQAFLKTLEEPPGNSQIYLVTSFPDILLPTIVSRVQIIKNSDHSDLPEVPDWVVKFLSAGVGDRIKMLDTQALNRESALEFINHIEHLLHQNIISGKAQRSHVYDLVSDTRKYLKSNCNVKLTLDHLALNLS